MPVVLRRYCPVCKAIKPAEKQSENTALHVVLCICTGLIWLPIWMIWSGLKGYACRECGATTQSPMLRTMFRAGVALAMAVAAILVVMKLISP